MGDAAEQQPELTREEIAANKAAEYRANFEASTQADEVPPAEPEAAPEPTEHTPPPGVPEKFFNKETGEVDYEKWGKAHSFLESKFHDSRATPDGDGGDDKGGDPDPAGATPEAGEGSPAGLEHPAVVSAMENYQLNGELAETDYESLEQAGFPRAMVDAYIAGTAAQGQVLTDAAYSVTNGADGYTEMMQWASENLSEAEIRAYNTQMEANDPEVIKVATQSLFDRYSQTANIEGGRVAASPGVSPDSELFHSQQEVTAAMNKMNDQGRRLYDVDPGYRTRIAARIGRSKKAGTL